MVIKPLCFGRRDANWMADLERYPPRPFLREQSIWAIAVYRFGRRVDACRKGLRRTLLSKVYWVMYRVVETLTGITLPKECVIGPGLRIWHFGNIIVHSDSIIGARCSMRHGVTIGNRYKDGPVPVIGDDVDIGAYAQILGGVHVGSGARIGAMTLVLHDVPPGATVVGNPGRVVDRGSTSAALDLAEGSTVFGMMN